MSDIELQLSSAQIHHHTISAKHRRFVSYQTIGFLVASLEAVLILLGSDFGPLAYGRVVGYGNSVFDGSLGAGIFSSAFYVTIAVYARLYSLPVLINPGRHIRRIAAGCCITILSLTAVLFLLKNGSAMSRGALVAFASVMLVVCCLTRIGAAGFIGALVAKNQISGRPVFVIGEPDELSSIRPSFLLLQFGLQEAGRASLDRENGQDNYARSVDAAMKLVRSSTATEVLVASKFDSLDHLSVIERALRTSPLPARLLPNHVFRSVLGRFESGQGSRFNLIDLQRAPLSFLEQALKRSIDVCFALSALLLLSPLLAAAAVAVKLESSGPSIFRQRRNGYNRHHFQILKFRTMTVMEDGETIVQARAGDARVTRIGRVLRRSSVDELPQLWNVLKGDMSLVGPRPHALAHDKTYEAIIGDYSLRHHVKPGITGWAQVNGFRGETAQVEQMKARVDLDLWYINNWSFWLDIQILIRTMLEVIKQRAY